ncbi:6350_t:CDS:2 [Paraglomus occultum]|uniref:6350_t:CDS:1 n=1 Tax=Paraglomus occultum TaxID=144539 RepID=A0A9N9F7R3_9GLOM|nr:6350_t:CDS:2 [Paraglomus occultum]
MTYGLHLSTQTKQPQLDPATIFGINASLGGVEPKPIASN